MINTFGVWQEALPLLSYKQIFTNLNPNKKRMTMDANMIIQLVLKVVAMAMGIASIVIGFFPQETTVNTHITLAKEQDDI